MHSKVQRSHIPEVPKCNFRRSRCLPLFLQCACAPSFSVEGGNQQPACTHCTVPTKRRRGASVGCSLLSGAAKSYGVPFVSKLKMAGSLETCELLLNLRRHLHTVSRITALASGHLLNQCGHLLNRRGHLPNHSSSAAALGTWTFTKSLQTFTKSLGTFTKSLRTFTRSPRTFTNSLRIFTCVCNH